MRKLLIIWVAVALLSITANAQIRSYSNEFLAIGVGARALAMGNTQSALVNDVTAAYWNPAGLTSIDNIQIAAQHAEWFAGISKYDYGGIALPIDQGFRTLGLSLIRFGVDDIPNTLQLVQPDGSICYDCISTFSAADYGILLSYAQPLRKIDNLSIGFNTKIIRRKVGSFANAWGFGLDFGAQYKFDFGLDLGLTLKDVTTTFNAWSFNWTDEEKIILEETGNIIPSSSVELTGQRLILGAAYGKRFKDDKFGFLLAADLDFTFDGKRNTLIKSNFTSIDPHLGLEIDYDNLVFLRAGINNIQKITDDYDQSKSYTTIQPNIGIGFKIKMVTIDYAFTGLNAINRGFYSHVFSLKFDIKPRDKTKNQTTPTTSPNQIETLENN